MSLAQSFGQSAFARFINSPTGRVVRIVAGIVLIAWGYTNVGSGIGLAIMLVGIVPLAAGVFDWCLVSALLGGPLSGARIRSGS
jgi:hypothetical protein